MGVSAEGQGFLKDVPWAFAQWEGRVDGVLEDHGDHILDK